MKRRLFIILLAVAVCVTAGGETKEVAKLNAWVTPCGLDVSPCEGNAGRYTVYMTEFVDEDVSGLQTAVIIYGAQNLGCIKICDMFLYDEHNGQYATYMIEYEADADTSTVIDGKYTVTGNTVAVIVYDDGVDKDVCIVDQVYDMRKYYGCYYVDDKEAGERYAPWIHNGGTGTEEVAVDNSDVRKVMIDGKIYVVKDGAVYDLWGRFVRGFDR